MSDEAATAPSATLLSSAGTSANVPSSVGTSGTVPSSAGTSANEPSSVGTSGTLPSSAGTSATEPSATGTSVAGKIAAGTSPGGRIAGGKSAVGTVRCESTGRIALLTIDRPAKRNAMSGAMWRELQAHLAAIAVDDEVIAVVVRGAGGAFSAGGDLHELRDHGAEHAEAYRRHAEDVVRALAGLPVPTIAVVEGACFGAGCSIALACDVRIATPAARFGIPALRNGLVYEPEFVQRLARIVGQGPAALLLFGGETWSAATAERHGLVDRCVDDTEPALDALLGALRSAAPAAIRSTAAAIRSA